MNATDIRCRWKLGQALDLYRSQWVMSESRGWFYEAVMKRTVQGRGLVKVLKRYNCSEDECAIEFNGDIYWQT